MTRPVHLVGRGLLCARGDSPEAVAAALWQGGWASGRRRVGEREFPYFPLPLAQTDWLARAQRAVRCVGQQLGALPASTPLFVASSSFQIGHFEQRVRAFRLVRRGGRLQPRHCRLAESLRAVLQRVRTPAFPASAIDAARSLIAGGLIDDAVVLGCELANDLTPAGFAAMELLSASACRPFDACRDGLVLGEAVAAVPPVGQARPLAHRRSGHRYQWPLRRPAPTRTAARLRKLRSTA